MKYDVLHAYREHLHGVFDNQKTADRYYFALDKLFKRVYFDKAGEISRETIETLLTATEPKQEFIKAKNALKHFKAFDSTVNLPTAEFFKELSAVKHNHQLRPVKIINHDNICRKVNALRNVKLKLAYRLMMNSGLRVSECAALQKRDILISGDGVVKIDVKHGKGGSNDVVTVMPDKWLTEKLTEYLKPLDSEEKPFYAAQTMKNKAGKLGLECHDLRRIAAITFRQSRRDDGEALYEANGQTRDFLRHTRFSVTKRYLMNRKLKFIKKSHRKYKKR